MTKMKAYLAGKMSGLTFEEMNNWRVEASKMLIEKSNNRIHVINPCSYYNFQMDKDTYTEKEVMKFDLNMVKQSNIILVNLKHPDTIGTAIELFGSSEIWDIPVIGFGETIKYPCHPWMKLCLTKECKVLEDAVDYIIDFYLPNF